MKFSQCKVEVTVNCVDEAVIDDHVDRLTRAEGRDEAVRSIDTVVARPRLDRHVDRQLLRRCRAGSAGARAREEDNRHLAPAERAMPKAIA